MYLIMERKSPMEGSCRRVRELLSKSFPNVPAATAEIINLNAILHLPKGTEHFLSDLHGEYEAFSHILRNASGVIRIKIQEVFAYRLTQREKDELATLIYYPRERLAYLREQGRLSQDSYCVLLHRLVELCRWIASKYTRSKVRKAMPAEFRYMIEELLCEQQHFSDKDDYYKSILDTLIRTRQADAIIIAIAHLMQRLAVDCLHILGDIFDRGTEPDTILDALMAHHNLDITWGNHDILWMGAAAGNPLCIASVVRICARYDHPEILENGYGISLRELFSFGERVYESDPCTPFFPLVEHCLSEWSDPIGVARMHKAITVIALKLEGAFLGAHPEYGMSHRCLLEQIDYAARQITLGDTTYPMIDALFPTVDPMDPYRLSEEEAHLMAQLRRGFLKSQRLQTHIRFLFAKGSMYRVANGNLMFHGCIPLEEDGSFSSFLGYRGKALLDYWDATLRKGYFLPDHHPQKKAALDAFWYLWSGPCSPLFGKDKMTTFERYFLKDPATHRERKNPYYRWMAGEQGEATARRILREFSLSEETGRMINGHVPVRHSRGESPVKAGGKLFVIDGGLSRAYQKTTGIAGYTLIFNSHGFLLTAHQPFASQKEAVEEMTDIASQIVIRSPFGKRLTVADTDTGTDLKRQITELEELVRDYRSGTIKEQ